MEHDVYFDMIVEDVDGTKTWERTHLEFSNEQDAFEWCRRYTWSSKIKNIKLYPKHYSNKI